MPSKAIVRPPGTRYTGCISSHPRLKELDAALAREQHRKYVATLRDLGLEVIEMPALDSHPDSCFVEDTAVVHGKKALIANLRPPSRKGEEVSVEELLKTYLECRSVPPPATLEGGDVIHLPDRLISGVTQRTSPDGVDSMSGWLGVRVDTVEDQDVVHLKSHVTYLDEGILLGTRRFSEHPVFGGLKMLLIPQKESYAANALFVNGTVLVAAGHPKTAEAVRRTGFEVIELPVTEFEKCEGALTCLSIIF